MATSQEQETVTKPKNEGSMEALLAIFSETADAATGNQLWADSLKDASLREQIALSLPLENENDLIEAAIADSSFAPSPSLSRRFAAIAQEFIRPAVETTPVSLWGRVLQTVETLLTLPCLSPALAAPESLTSFSILAQTVQTPEGASILFQQLPTASPNGLSTLRLLIDVSAIEEPHNYIEAKVTLSEGNLPPWVFLVPLNERGTGFLDITDLPAATVARRLVAVQLRAR